MLDPQYHRSVDQGSSLRDSHGFCGASDLAFPLLFFFPPTVLGRIFMKSRSARTLSAGEGYFSASLQIVQEKV